MFRDLPPYGETRFSDFWTSKVPSSWSELPWLAVLEENRRTNKGLVEDQVLSLSYGKVIVKPVEKQRGLVPESYEGYQILGPGDIVVRPTDLQNDQTSIRVGHVRDRGIITSAYIGLRPRGEWRDAYAYLYLSVIDSSKRIYGMGSGLRQQLGWDDLKRMPCLVPPVEEQAAIVKYLAHANARIDNAIAAKRRLIALLEEQSLAVAREILSGRSTSHCRFDDGHRVPWIGKVPSKWGVAPLKRVARLRSGAGFPVNRQGHPGEELPFFRVSDMNLPQNLDWLATCESTVSRAEAADLGAVVFDRETIVFPKVGGALLTNKRRLLERPSCIDNNMMGATFFGLERDYAFEIMQLIDMADIVKPGPVPAVGQGDIGAIQVPIPPSSEQLHLVSVLKAEGAEVNDTIRAASAEITLLQEFRTRLVADVVTGQVDVRAVAETLPDPSMPDVSLDEDGIDLDDLYGHEDD